MRNSYKNLLIIYLPTSKLLATNLKCSFTNFVISKNLSWNLLSYIKAKTTFFETYSREDFSFSRYKHRRLTVRILLLFWFLLLGTLLFLPSLVKGNFIFYLGLGGWLIVGLISLIFYIRFKKLKKRIVKNINFPYYRRAINFEKLKHFFKIAGATVWFQGQFMFEHKPLDEM